MHLNYIILLFIEMNFNIDYIFDYVINTEDPLK